MARRKLKFTKIGEPITLTQSEGRLYAKSLWQGNHSLAVHSVEAARMALTLTNQIFIPNAEKSILRKCVFISALFHDLGKAAVGFQNMIRGSDRWPPINGGNRHEVLSAIIFMINYVDMAKNTDFIFELSSINFAIITHHKPIKEDFNTNLRTIPLNQWFGDSQFRNMYNELLVNKDLLQTTWKEIIQSISNDKWAQKLIKDNWLPTSLILPSLEELEIILDSLLDQFKIKGLHKWNIDKREFHSIYKRDEIRFLQIIRVLTTVGDHLSSGENLFVPDIPNLKEYDIFTKKERTKGYEEYEFQTRCSYQGNLMLRAPTGSGKTQAAFNWMKHNQIHYDGDGNSVIGKLYYVLPFQASINAMYKRLNEWLEVLPGQLVGLQHSRSANTLYALIEEEMDKIDRPNKKHKNNINDKKKVFGDMINPWKDYKVKSLKQEEFSDLVFTKENVEQYKNTTQEQSINKKQRSKAANNLASLSREIFYPVKVSTPHQLLKGILQGRGWEVLVQDFSNAIFVFDEIHAYDAHLTGLILSMSKLLITEFNARILFMSASFPNFLIEKINSNISADIPLIVLNKHNELDKIILEKTRHMVTIKNEKIDTLMKSTKFRQKLLNSKSTLIICNTVQSAQNTYDQLKSDASLNLSKENMILFHSRFKLSDRRKKENKISAIKDRNSKIKVVVATQVVEVSLDIDLEFGIFEGAPLDALVQRFGRVNRKGKRAVDDSNIWICEPSDYSHLIYNTDHIKFSIELLNRTQGKLISETQLVELINSLYDKYPWNEKQKTHFKNTFTYNKIRDFHDHIIPASYRYWIDDILEGQTTIDVLLEVDEINYRTKKSKSALEANGLIIPARIKKKELRENKNRRGPPIINIKHEYSEEYGLKLFRSNNK